jgi:hypothetical protein
MNRITLVYAYFENGPMLDLHLAEWSKYKDKDRWRAVIVDDCSKRDPAINHMYDVGFPIELYRINNDIPWNQDGARNLAMTQSDGWCLMCDMDHLLPIDSAEFLESQVDKLASHRHYNLPRYRSDGTPIDKIPPNVMIIHNDLFWSIGGYDERFCGYYGSDVNFLSRLSLKSVRGIVLRKVGLTMYSGDEIEGATTTDYGRKNSEYHIRNNPEILRMLHENRRPIPPMNFEYERLL